MEGKEKITETSESEAISSNTLPDTLIEKAEKELGEKPKWRERDVNALRDLLKDDRALYCPIEDDAFLLMFLRARKFDYDRAYKLLHRYYEVRNEYPDVFERFKPSNVKNLYEQGVLTKLPKVNVTDPTVLMLRPGKWDPDVQPMDDVLKANIMQVDQLIRAEENQVNGFIFVVDMSEVGWHQAKNLNPFRAKMMLSIIQHAMPCRMKAIHYVNVPHFFEYLFNIVKQFMSEKLRSRVHIHATADNLKDHFDMSIMPTTLGGELDLDAHCPKWAETMLSYDEEFVDRAKYGIKQVDMVSSKESKTADPTTGITGTFRKLNCD